MQETEPQPHFLNLQAMAEKLRQTCMKAYSKPLTLRWSRRSNSLALFKNLSMLTCFLKGLAKRLTQAYR